MREKTIDETAEEISVQFGSEFELDRRDLNNAIRDALRARDEAERERCCRLLCKFCGNNDYNLIWHHQEWRHYRKRDMYVEWCQAAILRGRPSGKGVTRNGQS